MMTRGTPWIAGAARWSWILLLPLSPGPIQGQAADSVRPLTFAEARALLLDRSPELEVQRARVDQSRALSRQTLSTFLPRIDLDAFYLNTGLSIPIQGLLDPGRNGSRLPRQGHQDPGDPTDPTPPRGDLDLRVTAIRLQQPLVNVGGWFARREARIMVEAVDRTSQRVHEAMEFALLEAYLDARLARERLEALGRGLEAAREAVREAEGLHREGLAPRLDILSARVEMAEVQGELAVAHADSVASQVALQRLLDLPVPIDPVEEAALGLLPPLPDLDEALQGISRRADVEAQLRAREASDFGRRRARAALWPRLNAFGSYVWLDEERFLGGGPDLTVGIFLSWSPFQGMRQVGGIQEAAGRAREEEARLEGLQREAVVEVVSHHARLQGAAAERAAADEAWTAAAEAVELARGLYREQLGTMIQLLDAEARERRAALRQVAARHRQVLAAGSYLLAAGRWQAHP